MVDIYEVQKKSDNETALVLLCIRCFFKTSSEKEIQNFINSNKINWKFFQQVVLHHKVKAIVYRELLKVELPKEQETSFKLQLVKLTVKVQNQIKQTLYVVDLLKKNNIDVLPFKGFVLSDLLYNKLDYRDSIDIDFAIQTKDTADIIKIMKSEGFIFDKEQGFNLKNPARYIKNNADIVFYKKDFFSLEFHWRVNQIKIDFNKNSAVIDTKKQFVKEIKSDYIKVLTLQEHAKHVYLHHIFSDGLAKFKHWIELAILFRSLKNNNEFNTFLKQYNYVDNDLILEVLYSFFGIKLLPSFKGEVPKISSKKVVDILNTVLEVNNNSTDKRTISQRKKDILVHQRYVINSDVKMKLFFRRLHSFIKPWGKDFNTVKLPEKLYFLYYFVRLYRVILEYVFKKTI